MTGTRLSKAMNFLSTFYMPQTFQKNKKLQTSCDRINPFSEPINESINKHVKGEETGLSINNLANLTVMNAFHQNLESRQLPPV